MLHNGDGDNLEAIKNVIAKSKEFAKEIRENDEIIWLEDLRWYRSKQEVGKPPKSLILSLLFCFEGLIKCHCQVAHKIILTKRNTENFLDEYGTRWISFSDLIMSMEEEMWFLEDTINEIWPLFSKEEFAPRYSILRMMCRQWGKYVTKLLLPDFIDKIKDILGQYHGQMYEVSLMYKTIMAKKYGANSLKHNCSMKTLTRDLLLQSIQMIVDISLNEISINYIESTNVQLGKYYTEVEEVILLQSESFLKQLAEFMKPNDFVKLSSLYFIELKSVFPKTTQRKLHELVMNYQIKQCETSIHKVYKEFMEDLKMDEHFDLKSMPKKSPTFSKKFSDTDLKLILGKQQDQRISHLIHDIIYQCENSEPEKASLITPYKITGVEEEYKIMPLKVEKRKISSMPVNICKEKAASFYLQVMITDKDTVMLLNKCHNTLNEAIASYDDSDEIIQNDNITRRIPDHLEENDKKKFELIRQESSFNNEEFYKKYIEPETLDMLRHQSVENEQTKNAFVDMYEIDDEFDEFDELDKYLLTDNDDLTLTRAKP